MKNMKVRTKMLAGFLIVAAIGVLLGAVGMVSLMLIKSYTEEVEILQDTSAGATDVLNAHYIWRQNLIEAVLTGSGFTGSLDPGTCSLGKWLDSEQAKSIEDAVVLDLLRQIEEPHRYIHTEAARIIELTDAGELETAKTYLVNNVFPQAHAVIMFLSEIGSRFDDLVAEGLDNIIALESTTLLIIIVLIVAAVASSVLLAVYVSGLISKPLSVLTAFMKRAGSTGNIALEQADIELIEESSRQTDELGECITASATFVKHVVQSSDELEAIAGGDLTVNVKVLSDADTMGSSLKKMVVSLNNMFSEINNSTSQVSVGSRQIADSSQALASGSTQQAAAVEELSASVADISVKTKHNAEIAGKAADLAKSIKNKAEAGSRQMDEMMQAVSEITQASQNINRVIKVIDDIAFQTNILALNAAVEAARAGQHGKGFAVVAEEVRNLAAKSAEAAKDTGGLIANSMEKAELGAKIAQDTAASLTDIVMGINESSKIVEEIAASSGEQSASVEQINIGLNQVTQVIQQNSATAEESAAASQEMSGQSAMLEDLVRQFKLK